MKESPLTIPKKNSGGVSIPPPDPSYDQRKGCGPSFGNLPEGYVEGMSSPCGGRGVDHRVTALLTVTALPPCHSEEAQWADVGIVSPFFRRGR